MKIDTGLVTAEALARRLSLSVSTVHELARLGRIPCRMFGRYRRFSVADVVAAGGSKLDELGIEPLQPAKTQGSTAPSPIAVTG